MDLPDVAEPRKIRGIYLLPNLFTTAGLFSGFFAIIMATNGQFESACIAIFIAMIMDGIDGRLARLTNTQSAFGAEYDSLADMVSFAMAPALIAYSWGLHHLGKIGWLVAFVFAAGGALRLARFNTQIGKADKRYFQGLPSPAAAALISGFLWIAHDSHFDSSTWAWPLALLTLCGGLLMVSNFRFHSFKQIDLKGKIPFVVLLVLVLAFVLVASDPPKILFGIFLCYAVSGPLLTLWHRTQMRRKNRAFGKGSAAEETSET